MIVDNSKKNVWRRVAWSRRGALGAAVFGALALEGAYGCVGETGTEDFIEENIGEVEDALVEMPASPSSTDSYSMSFRPSASDTTCNSFFDNYGCHAIQWKGKVDTQHACQNPKLGIYEPANSTCWGALWPTADCLNDQEANTSIFSANPCGAWYEGTYFDSDELAVGAAMMMFHWKTPVYAEMKYDFDGDGWQDYAVAAIEKITFSVTGSKTTLHDTCDWLGFENPENTVDNVDSNCAFFEGSKFDVASVEISYWTTIPSGVRKTMTLSGSQFAAATSGISTYVYDPPSEAEAKKVLAHARATYLAVKDHLRFRTPDQRSVRLSEIARPAADSGPGQSRERVAP